MYGDVTQMNGTTVTLSLTVIPLARPSAATWVTPSADGRLEMLVVATDLTNNGSMWHRWQTAPSNGWSG